MTGSGLQRASCAAASVKEAPTVAVVIVNWQSADYLEKCLRGLAEQSTVPDRIVIVDNSQDLLPERFENTGLPNLRIIRPDRNLGFAAANNVGAQYATGCEWLALINPDAFPHRNWLSSLLRAAKENPAFSFFGCRLKKSGSSGILDGTGDAYHTSGMVWRQGHGVTETDQALVPREIFSPCAAAALYRSDAFSEVGGFDESYFCFSEDVDLGFRLRLAGYRCLYVPTAVADHEGSGVTGRHSDFSVYHGHRNLVWTFLKDMPGPLFMGYLPQHLILNFVSILWFSLKGQSMTILRAKLDALRGIPQVWRKRAEVQAKRRVSSWRIRRIMTTGITQFERFRRLA
jgi:GT2 family glycosyltransferase